MKWISITVNYRFVYICWQVVWDFFFFIFFVAEYH